MTSVRFFESNDIRSPFVDLTYDEIATQFWQSSDAAEWLAKPGGERFPRCLMRLLMNTLGGWDPDETNFDDLNVTVWEARPT